MRSNIQKIFLGLVGLSVFHCGRAGGGATSASPLLSDTGRDESYVSSANTTGQSAGEIAYADYSRGVIQVFGLEPFEHRRVIELAPGLGRASLKSLYGGKMLVAYNSRNVGIQKGDHFDVLRDITLVGDFSRVITNGRRYLALADVTGGLYLAEISDRGDVVASWVGGSSIDAEKPFEIKQGAFVGENRLVFATDERLLVVDVAETLGRGEMAAREIATKGFTATRWLAAASGDGGCAHVVALGDGEMRTIDTGSGETTASAVISDFEVYSRGEYPITHAVLRPRVREDLSSGRNRVRVLQVSGGGEIRTRDIFVAAGNNLGTIRETYLEGDTLTVLARSGRSDPINVRKIRLKDSLVTALRDIPAYSAADRIFFAGAGVMAVTKSALGKVWFDRLGRDGTPEEVTGFNRAAVVH